MCGIFGYFDKNYKVLDRVEVEKMGAALVHRGPDDQGIYFGSAAAIGNQRLSIIDIAGGNQPFLSDDGMIAVVQNGEIFNHIELAEELNGTRFECRTHSDTEVLLRLYEKEGINFVSRLNGMFAIAIYDKREDALYLIRDRIGVKPLYIYESGGRLLFASEIKAILKAGIVANLNEEAIHHFLSFNYVPPPHTVFKGINHLMPGHLLRLGRDGSRKLKKWWSLADNQNEIRSEQQWQDEIIHSLSEAVRLRLRSDVPFGAFLSGGIDSSTVVGLMAKHQKNPVLTFNIGFEDKNYDETPYAIQASERFKTKHITETVHPNMLDLWPMALYHCDQPHGDISFLPTYRVCSLASQYVKMVLTGDGGDEIFAGYEKHLSFFASPQAMLNRDSFERSYFNSISLFDNAIKESLYVDSFAQKIHGIDSFDIVRPLFEESQHWDRVNQALNIDMQLLLPGNNLVKPDRMGMAVSLEARTPFLDYRMMELGFKIPGDLKIKNGQTKYILKKAVSDLIGNDLAYRKKQMFTVPVGEWFKDELAPYCREVLLSKDAFINEIFKAEVVATMLEKHIAGTANYTREIRALLAIETWAKKFFI